MRVSVAELRTALEESAAGLGLSLDNRPEWSEVSFGTTYTVSYFLAGPRILYIRTTGFATAADIEQVAEFERRLRGAHAAPGASYVRIEDWSRMPGASRGARDRYLRYVLGDPLLLAIVFVKLPALYRLPVALCRRTRRLRFSILFVDRHDKAFATAQILLAGQSPRRPVPAARPADWILELPGFSLRFQALGGKVLLAEASGRFTPAHLPPSLRLQEQAFVESGLAPHHYQFVLGLEKVTGFDPRARRPYVEAIRRFHERHPMSGATVFGISGIVKAAVNMYRAFMPFPVSVVGTRAEALAPGPNGDAPTPRRQRGRPRRWAFGLSAYRRQLLEYLERLGWEVDGSGDTDQWPARHPLAPVFEAIRLLKWEFDDLLAAQAKSQEELRAAKEIAERADRAKSGFLASVSHELRTPLNHIMGFTDLVLRGAPGSMSVEQREMLGDIAQAGHRLCTMVDRLLDIAKMETGRLELRRKPVDPCPLLAGSLAEVAEVAAAKGLSLELVDRDLPAAIPADPEKLRQILRNLLSNAVEFTPRGGSVVLTARRAGSDDGREMVEISVADTGIGIAAADVPRMFHPFSLTDRPRTATTSTTGLSLALCRRLVELHGGSIRAQSAGPGRGATFLFSLPLGDTGEG